MEIWKDVEGYEGLYQISNFGNVKSFNYLGHGVIKILKPRATKTGYLRVQLSVNGCKKDRYIHRLVAESFIPTSNSLLQINHIDENKSNNNVNNLEWCTAKYNCNYGNRNSKAIYRDLSKSYSPVMQLDMDGNFISKFKSMSEASSKTGVISQSISLACLGKYKQAGGFIWRYDI